MWRHPIFKVLLLTYIAWGAWNWFSNRPYHQPDGILAPDDPVQTDVANGEKIKIGRWMLTIRAHYQVTARILGRKRYYFDSITDLIPEDLALGWGSMSDNRVLKNIDISQSNRFYYWRTPVQPPIPKNSIITHSANTHVIPLDASVKRQLLSLRPGQIVTLSGELVDALREDGASIKTSLVRNDTGAGACEVVLVSEVSVEAH